ncbi:hypothetical protein Tco_1276916 [Tanacetum coccineum]
MHTSRDDYLINTMRFFSANEESQIYGAQLPESMTSLEMRETKAYKTYLGYATGVTPHKKTRKFKKPASPKLSQDTPVTSLFKKKEKMTAERRKGIKLLSEVALTEEAYNINVNELSRSDSEHETDENETGSEFDQEENEEEIKDDEEEKDG